MLFCLLFCTPRGMQNFLTRSVLRPLQWKRSLNHRTTVSPRLPTSDLNFSLRHFKQSKILPTLGIPPLNLNYYWNRWRLEWGEAKGSKSQQLRIGTPWDHQAEMELTNWLVTSWGLLDTRRVQKRAGLLREAEGLNLSTA